MSQTYADTFRNIVEEETAAIKAEQEEKRLARGRPQATEGYPAGGEDGPGSHHSSHAFHAA